jgi:hypothetical protein
MLTKSMSSVAIAAYSAELAAGGRVHWPANGFAVYFNRPTETGSEGRIPAFGGKFHRRIIDPACQRIDIDQYESSGSR